MYIGIHHAALTVSNLKKSKEFFGELLEFKEIARPNFSFDGAWYQIGGQQLHLIVKKETAPARSTQSINPKNNHLAIDIPSYEKMEQFLKDKKILILQKPKSISGFKQIFCKDPDGNVLEFKEIN